MCLFGYGSGWIGCYTKPAGPFAFKILSDDYAIFHLVDGRSRPAIALAQVLKMPLTLSTVDLWTAVLHKVTSLLPQGVTWKLRNHACRLLLSASLSSTPDPPGLMWSSRPLTTCRLEESGAWVNVPDTHLELLLANDVTTLISYSMVVVAAKPQLPGSSFLGEHRSNGGTKDLLQVSTMQLVGGHCSTIDAPQRA